MALSKSQKSLKRFTLGVVIVLTARSSVALSQVRSSPPTRAEMADSYWTELYAMHAALGYPLSSEACARSTRIIPIGLRVPASASTFSNYVVVDVYVEGPRASLNDIANRLIAVFQRGALSSLLEVVDDAGRSIEVRGHDEVGPPAYGPLGSDLSYTMMHGDAASALLMELRLFPSEKIIPGRMYAVRFKSSLEEAGIRAVSDRFGVTLDAAAPECPLRQLLVRLPSVVNAGVEIAALEVDTKWHESRCSTLDRVPDYRESPPMVIPVPKLPGRQVETDEVRVEDDL